MAECFDTSTARGTPPKRQFDFATCGHRCLSHLTTPPWAHRPQPQDNPSSSMTPAHPSLPWPSSLHPSFSANPLVHMPKQSRTGSSINMSSCHFLLVSTSKGGTLHLVRKRSVGAGGGRYAVDLPLLSRCWHYSPVLVHVLSSVTANAAGTPPSPPSPIQTESPSPSCPRAALTMSGPLGGAACAARNPAPPTQTWPPPSPPHAGKLCAALHCLCALASAKFITLGPIRPVRCTWLMDRCG